jgi:hypothetical protein
MGFVGYNPRRKHNDLPLECQANQIPKTAIKAEEMPKIICMVTSSFIIMWVCLRLRMGFVGGVDGSRGT